MVVNAYDALGLGYMNEEEYGQAIDCFKVGLKLAEEKDWSERLSGIARDIAIAYKNAKNTVKRKNGS